jgi:trimeric autotransporter adhesin
MSTKTLRKRIALVAVSALGFGLVSAAPSSAAATANFVVVAGESTVYGTTSAAAVTDLKYTASAATDATSTITITPTIVSQPVSGGVTVGQAGANSVGATISSPAGTTTAASATAGKFTLSTSAGVNTMGFLTATTGSIPAVTTAEKIGTLSLTTAVPGKYVIDVTPAGASATNTKATVTFYISTAPSAPTATSATALTTSTDKTVYRADLDSVTLNVTRPVGGVASDGDVNYVVVTSPDAGMTPGTIVTASTSTRETAGGYVYATGANNSSLQISNNFVNTQGAYSVRAYVDTNGDDVYQSTETSALFSWIMAAAPDALSVSFDKSSAVTTTSLQLFGVVTVKDDEGYASYLDGSETITTTFSEDKGVTYTSTKLTVGTALSTSTRISATNTYRTVINAYNGGTALVASVDAYRIKIAITGATTAATASFTSVDADASRLTSLSMTSVDGLITGSGATLTTTIPANVPAATLAATAVRSDLPVKTHTFTLVGTPLKTYAVTFSVGSLTNIANFTYPTSVRTLTDGAVVFTVTNSAPTEDDSYAISVVDTTSTVLYAGYSVTWDDLEASWSMSPTASSNPKVLKATTNKVTATLRDNFGRVLANAPYSVSVSGRNVTAASGTTDATGTATYTVTDTATSSYTTYPSDTVTFSSVATTTIAAGTGAVTFSYVETLAAVSTVTVSNPTDLTMDIDQREATAGAAADRKTWTATVRLATGAVAGSGVLVTFAADADTIFYLGVNTGVTDASGQATVTAFKRKAGNILMTATANGVSGSALVPVVAANADGNGTSSASVRTIAVLQRRQSWVAQLQQLLLT